MWEALGRNQLVRGDFGFSVHLLDLQAEVIMLAELKLCLTAY